MPNSRRTIEDPHNWNRGPPKDNQRAREKPFAVTNKNQITSDGVNRDNNQTSGSKKKAHRHKPYVNKYGGNAGNQHDSGVGQGKGKHRHNSKHDNFYSYNHNKNVNYHGHNSTSPNHKGHRVAFPMSILKNKKQFPDTTLDASYGDNDSDVDSNDSSDQESLQSPYWTTQEKREYCLKKIKQWTEMLEEFI